MGIHMPTNRPCLIRTSFLGLGCMIAPKSIRPMSASDAPRSPEQSPISDRPVHDDPGAVRHRQLWAPWRLAYVTGGDAPAAASDAATQLKLATAWLPGADHGCFLCRAVAETT